MRRPTVYALLAIVAAFSLSANSPGLMAQQVEYSYSGCTNRQGQPVPAQADSAAKRVVETRILEGKPVIAYNSEVLAYLLPESRLFLFAHECARHQLGLALDQDRTLEQARRADCQAVATLRRSNLIKEEDLPKLQDDLIFNAEDWAMLPGPSRTFELSTCMSGANASGNLAVPDAPVRSPAWNRCVSSCGSRLFSCGRSNSCQSAYEACSAGCEKY